MNRGLFGHPRGGKRLTYARIERVTSGNQTIVAGTAEPGTVIIWDTKVEDTAGLVDLAANPGRITIQKPCLLTVEFGVRYPAGNPRAAITARVTHPDGTSKQFARSEIASGVNDWNGLCSSCTMRFNPHDYIELLAWSNAAGNTVVAPSPSTFLAVVERQIDGLSEGRTGIFQYVT